PCSTAWAPWAKKAWARRWASSTANSTSPWPFAATRRSRTWTRPSCCRARTRPDPRSAQLVDEGADHAQALHARAAAVVLVAVGTADGDHALVGELEGAQLRAGLGRELLRLFARIAGGVAQQRPLHVVEAAQLKLGAAKALAVELHTGLDQRVHGECGGLHVGHAR